MLREDIERLEQNGITRVAMTRLGDPAVIPLWFGEGDLVTPSFIREAAKQALDEGHTFYGHMRGRAELRTAIKAYLDRLYRIDVNPDRITVPGSSMLAVTMAAQMTLTSGLHGLIVSPHWPNVDRAFRVTGAHYDCVRQRWDAGRGWYLDLDDVRAALRPETRALFVNTPCNPTGWVMTTDEQRDLLTLCRDRGIVVIADEVYHRTVFDGDAAPSFLEIAADDDPLIVINGFSKAFAMTGWRLGWMVTPPAFVEQMAVLSECFNTSAPSFIQRAGVVALERGEDVVTELRGQYHAGRACVMEVLGDHPLLELAEPEGAFYAFPRVPGLASSLDFVRGVLAEENVGLAPGYTFGPGNESYFRLCYAQSGERLREALRRVVRYLERHAQALGLG
ncbi:MAG: pyridoxal phosphate-dependent aminotransferase [Gammaproteobacteria bacterium]